MHDPTTLDRQGNDVGDEYRSIILYHDDEQKQIAEDLAKNYAAETLARPRGNTNCATRKILARR